jgi:hypothetical protein
MFGFLQVIAEVTTATDLYLSTPAYMKCEKYKIIRKLCLQMRTNEK